MSINVFLFDAADGLTKHRRIAVNIEVVVLQLEGQTELFAKLVEQLSIALVGIGHQCAHLRRTGQQNARFQANHLDVLLFAHVVAMLEIHIILLSFTNFKGGFGEQRENLRQLFC